MNGCGMVTIAEKLATFVVDTSLRKMPLEVIGLTKRAMMDSLGVALAGSAHPIGKTITAFVESLGGKPVAQVIGSEVRTSSPLAALANGVMFHVLDYDDVKAGTQGHPSAVLMPVVLSLGEELSSSGEEIMEAYVLGVEIWAKISSIMPEFHLRGWHPTGVFGTIGAAAAAAKLLKLTRQQTTMALGIAGSEAGGLIQNFGTMTKSFHVGNAARGGVMAALLAGNGFTSAKNILEEDTGFIATFYGKTTAKLSKITENLGSPFALISPGLSMKKYPSCYSTHRALDAILHIIKLHHIKPEAVQAVTCQSNPVAQKALRYPDPSTALQGKFSMQFALAVALIDQRFTLAQATDKKVNDPVIKNFMKRVTLSVHPDWVDGEDTSYSRPDIVTVMLKNGRRYSYEVLTAKGDSKAPLAEEELVNKYRECAKLALGNEEVDRLLELIWKLEELDDIRKLTARLRHEN